MLLIIVPLICFVLGGAAVWLYALWSDDRFERRLLQRSFETVKGAGGIIVVAPLDPRRSGLSLHEPTEGLSNDLGEASWGTDA